MRPTVHQVFERLPGSLSVSKVFPVRVVAPPASFFRVHGAVDLPDDVLLLIGFLERVAPGPVVLCPLGHLLWHFWRDILWLALCHMADQFESACTYCNHDLIECSNERSA